MNILVIRFRQMGDAILATSLLNTLRRSFPDAQIDFVLNARIAPLFEGHPSIDRIITFTDDERHRFITYVRRVWSIVHSTRYDVIIDLRSTVNTMLFAMLSLSSRFRIGRKKWYTRLFFNHLIDVPTGCPMIDLDLAYAAPLRAVHPVEPIRDFTLCISDEEHRAFGDYLIGQGIDMTRPRILVNVTAKLAHKVWSEDKMVWVLQRFLAEYPDYQVIFNYAPGDEERNARRIYERLGSPRQVFIDVQAHSSRELVAMAGYMTCFFGNEGGARHVMHAAGCPTLVVCAPGSKKQVWIPQNQVLAVGIAPSDFASCQELSRMSREAQYDLISKESVWQTLQQFIQQVQDRK